MAPPGDPVLRAVFDAGAAAVAFQGDRLLDEAMSEQDWERLFEVEEQAIEKYRSAEPLPSAGAPIPVQPLLAKCRHSSTGGQRRGVRARLAPRRTLAWSDRRSMPRNGPWPRLSSALLVIKLRASPRSESPPMTYSPDPDRYDGRMPYRRCGRSGLDLPAISLGLWQNFGGDRCVRDRPRDAAPRIRPRRHPFRPREQLRPALRLRRGEFRPRDGDRLRRAPRRADRSRPRRAGTCGRGRMAMSAAAANI